MNEVIPRLNSPARHYYITSQVLGGLLIHTVAYRIINPKTGQPWQAARNLNGQAPLLAGVPRYDDSRASILVPAAEYAASCALTPNGWPAVLDGFVSAVYCWPTLEAAISAVRAHCPGATPLVF